MTLYWLEEHLQHAASWLCSILFSALEHNIFGNVSRLKLINSPQGEKLFDFNSAQGIFWLIAISRTILPSIFLNLPEWFLVLSRYFCCCEVGQQFIYIKPDDWALWMTRLGVRNSSKPGDMGGQLGSLASHEMLVRVGRTVPGAAQWLRMSCTPDCTHWPGSDCTPVHTVYTPG